MKDSELKEYLSELPAEAVSVSVYDYAENELHSFHGDVVFHAASTIKVAILAAVFAAAEEGRFKLSDRLHVRNHFISAGDGRSFQVSSSRDANTAVHAAIGKTLRIRELARHMIVTSSNLATNLLIDFVGVDYANEVLDNAGIDGVHLRRGVEDEAAFSDGLNNEITSDGLVALFRAIHERRLSGAEASDEMIAILADQEFNSGIPAGLPDAIRSKGRVAHKTGEISTVAHDAGIIFAPEREPVVMAICTRWDPETGGRMDAIAGITGRLWEMISPRTDA